MQIYPEWLAVPDNEGQFPCVGTRVASSSQEFYGLLHTHKERGTEVAVSVAAALGHLLSETICLPLFVGAACPSPLH